MDPAVLDEKQRLAMLPEIRSLLTQFTPSVAELPDEVWHERLTADGLVLVVVLDGPRLVASATLSVLTTLSLGRTGHVDDVVVDAELRGRGVGRMLMDAVHAQARRLGLRHLDLTSREERVAANRLYRSLGYEIRQTNPYRLRFALEPGRA